MSVTIPDDCKDLFAWLVRHDSSFKGSAAAMYAESLAGAEPLDEAVQGALEASQRQALVSALGDDV